MPPRRGARGRRRREPAVGAGRQRPAAARRGRGPRAPPPVPRGFRRRARARGPPRLRRRPRRSTPPSRGLAAALRVVRPSGALAGALLGTVVLGFGGAGLYVLLWVFFLGGTLATRFRQGAQGGDGEGRRRRADDAAPRTFSRTSPCPRSAPSPPAWARTRARFTSRRPRRSRRRSWTRSGRRWARRSRRRPSSFRTSAACRRARTAPCRSRARSPVSSAAGLLAWVGVAAFVLTAAGAVAVVLAALLGTVLESLLGRAGAPWRVSNGHVLNFVNTLAGAAAAPPLAALLGGLS